MLPDNNCFATSSFDCCCHLHSFSDYKKIGSLILGHDTMSNGWALKIDEEGRKKRAVEFAKDKLSGMDSIEVELNNTKKTV